MQFSLESGNSEKVHCRMLINIDLLSMLDSIPIIFCMTFHCLFPQLPLPH